MLGPALPPLLSRWSVGHALGLMAALALALVLGARWPVTCVALLSVGRLLFITRGRWTPSGGFGWANGLTALRLVLVALLSEAPRATRGLELGLLVLLILTLDGADGWVARRTHTSSELGAHFDMEVDALLVLTTSLRLWQTSTLGAWILLPGALRYVYVLCTARWPPRGGPMPRSLLGRSAFALVVVGHAAGLALTGRAGAIAAALGSAAVTLSFARSFFFSYARSVKPMLES